MPVSAATHPFSPLYSKRSKTYVLRPISQATALPHGKEQIVMGRTAQPDDRLTMRRLFKHPDAYLGWVPCEHCK